MEELKRQGECRLVELAVAEKPALFPSPVLAELAIAARQHPHSERPGADWVNRKRMREMARITVGGHEVFGTVFRHAGFDRVLTARQRTSARLFRDAVVCRLMQPAGRLQAGPRRFHGGHPAGGRRGGKVVPNDGCADRTAH